VLLALGDADGLPPDDDAALDVDAATEVEAVVVMVDGAAEDTDAASVEVVVRAVVERTLVAVVISVGTEEERELTARVDADEMADVRAELVAAKAEDALAMETEAEIRGMMGMGTCVAMEAIVVAMELAAEDALAMETEAEIRGMMGMGTCVAMESIVVAMELAPAAALEATEVAIDAAVLAALEAGVSMLEACVKAAEPATLDATMASCEAAEEAADAIDAGSVAALEAMAGVGGMMLTGAMVKGPVGIEALAGSWRDVV